MLRVGSFLITWLLMPALWASAQTPSADELTDDHVRAAIGAIVEELYARKHPDRFWEPASWSSSKHGSATQQGGYTALVTLALLQAGESYQAPRLKDAVQWLAGAELGGTYAVATRAHVWAQLPDRFKPKLEQDAAWLATSFHPPAAGWHYEPKTRFSRQDNSLRQYGALGLWEADKRGLHITRDTWSRLERAFIDAQLADGGWNYLCDEAPPRGSMTAAGLTVLFITQDLLHARAYLDATRPPALPVDGAIERGLAWMDENFSPERNPGRDADFYYYLYGVERVGLASGFRSFGGTDWYRAGAAELLRRLCRMNDDGSAVVHERVAGRGNGGEIRVHHLAFALMFLSRGRSAIAFNKLRIEGFAWNNRPRDVANLTGWLGGVLEPEVNWQVVDVDAPPETWLDAPVLYLASHEALPWVGAEPPPQNRSRNAQEPPAPPADPALVRLGRYLDLGGLLLAVDEGRGVFGRSVEAAGRALYPGLTWRDLPKDHWAFTTHQRVTGRRPRLRGLSNGVRELVILAERDDLSATFQARDIDETGHYQAAANVFFYGSEMTRQRARLARAALVHAPTAASSPVRIAQARYAGAWNPEPAALEAFVRHAGHPVELTTLAMTDLDDCEPAPDLVVVNGITKHAFTADETRAMQEYLARGGVLLFETPGGVGDFTEGAEETMAAQLGRPVAPVRDSRIITAEGLPGAERLLRVGYRPFALQQFGARETAPRLRGLAVDGELRVLFSREDISHALLDQPCWGVAGYTTESARRLLKNVALHARTLRRESLGVGVGDGEGGG